MHDLVAQGYSVFIHDPRGQGFSTRLLQGDGHGDKGHMDQFDHLVTYLESFLGQVQALLAGRSGQAGQANKAGYPRPLPAMAHSMGGAVLALHLAPSSASNEPALPNLAVAALVTPMFKPTIGQIGLGARVDRAAARW